MSGKCARCDYDLQGLASDLCPECGQPIRAFWMRLADPEELLAFRAGCQFIWLSIPLLYATVLFGIVGGITFELNVTVPIYVLLSLLATIYARGVWLVTLPGVSPLGSLDIPRDRRMVRLTLLVLPAGLAMSMLPERAYGSDGTTTIAWIIIVVLLCVLLVHYVALMSYVQWMGRRAEDPATVWFARTLRMGGPLVFIVLLVLVFAGPFVVSLLTMFLFIRLQNRLTELSGPEAGTS